MNQDVSLLWETPDVHAEFEKALVQNISFEAVLPKLLQTLTPREREVFVCIRKDRQNYEIAETLKISKARVSQLVTQVTLKLTREARRLGLTE